ncbi:MAG: FKBP-type peptidyl-prolyl cis-trans isomerase [Planctomycetota bacterium]|jgi:peptidylprolyl isomerase
MTNAKNGDTVQVHYTGKLDSGEVFDTSRGGDPLSFELGTQQVIPGFEAAVVGMATGDSTTVKIGCDDAYGPPRQELVIPIQRSELPDDLTPEVGMQLAMQSEDGEQVPVKITAVSDTEVTLDANHQLAGQDLTFDIELVAIGA